MQCFRNVSGRQKVPNPRFLPSKLQITFMAMILSFTGGVMVYATILSYMHFFVEPPETYPF